MNNYLSENNTLRWVEMILLFVIVPIILALPTASEFKFVVVGLSVIYVVYQMIILKLYKNVFSLEKPSRSSVLRMVIVGGIIFVMGAVAVYNYDSSLLFSVVYRKPLLWFFILFVYTFLSVVPQEMIYRHFFFNRYQSLVDNKRLFLLINMICFSLCHLFFMNTLVLLLTFIGGGLFATTYQNENNMTWVCLEHALYGNIIFTLGIGEMLAFPV